jgi:hypothetical protein
MAYVMKLGDLHTKFAFNIYACILIWIRKMKLSTYESNFNFLSTQIWVLKVILLKY